MESVINTYRLNQGNKEYILTIRTMGEKIRITCKNALNENINFSRDFTIDELRRLEKERLEKEKKEREKKNIFVFDEKEFPELKNNKEENKEKENNKGGKKGKKKGKKKFKDIEEDFLIDAFKPEETPKPKWKKSSNHN